MSSKHSPSQAHSHSGKIYEKVSLRPLPKSEVEVTFEISPENIAPFYQEALKETGSRAEFPGFRRGHAPEKLVEERFGQLSILEEAVEHALQHAYPEILKELSLDPLAPPKVAITKLAPGNPVTLRLIVAVFPTFPLPEYKTLAKNTPKEIPGEVTEKEIAEVLLEMRKIRSQKENPPGNGQPETTSLPELTDENVSALGNFQSVEELKKSVSENLLKEKKWRAREKRRLAIINNLTSKTTVSLPEVLVERETENMLARLKSDLTRMKLGLPEYLTHLKKTEEELRQSFRPEAEKRVTLELLLLKIAATEKIAPSAESVAEETKKLLDHHPGADPERARAYIENLLTHDQVFEFLERQ